MATRHPRGLRNHRRPYAFLDEHGRPSPPWALAEVIEVSGELDLAATEALEPVFQACVEESDGAVVADYTGVHFVDSMAVAQLIRMRRELAQDLRRFAVVSRLPKVRRVFTITGADRAVPVYDTLRDALAALPDPSARA